MTVLVTRRHTSIGYIAEGLDEVLELSVYDVFRDKVVLLRNVEVGLVFDEISIAA